MALFAFGFALALEPVAGSESLPQESELLRGLFLSNYPQSAKELEEFYGKAFYEMTYTVQSHRQDAWVSGGNHIAFSQNGSLFTFSVRPVEPVEKGEENDHVVIRQADGRIVAITRFEGRPEYVVTGRDIPLDQLESGLRRQLRPAYAPWSIGQYPILDLIDNDACSFRSFERLVTDGGEFLKVEYERTWEWEDDPDGKVTLEVGSLVLAPHFNWALVEADWQYRVIGNDEVIIFGRSCQVDYATSSNSEVFADKVEFRHTDADGNPTKKEVFQVLKFEHKEFPQSAFTLAAYGVKAPTTGSAPWWVVPSVVLLGIALLGFGSNFLYKRRSRFPKCWISR